MFHTWLLKWAGKSTPKPWFLQGRYFAKPRMVYPSLAPSVVFLPCPLQYLLISVHHRDTLHPFFKVYLLLIHLISLLLDSLFKIL